MRRSIAEEERDRAQAAELARSVAGKDARIEFPKAARSYAGNMNARAGAFREARAAFVERWDRDIAAAERGFVPGAARDGRETPGRNGQEAAGREDRAARAEPQAPELER